MDGFLFYLISWCSWIIVTFFICKQNEYRYISGLFLLLAIILSSYEINIFGYQVSLIVFIFLVVPSFLVVKNNHVSLLSLLISSLIISFAYAGFCLLALFDPIWVIFKQEIMISGLLFLLSISLQFQFLNQLIVVFIGAVNGEILYSITLKKLSLHYPIGNLAFLDIVAIVAINLYFIMVINSILGKLNKIIINVERGHILK